MWTASATPDTDNVRCEQIREPDLERKQSRQTHLCASLKHGLGSLETGTTGLLNFLNLGAGLADDAAHAMIGYNVSAGKSVSDRSKS